MEVKDTSRKNYAAFKNVPYGCVFITKDADAYYMKMKDMYHVNSPSVNLETGGVVYFLSDARVQPLSAHVVVTG